MTIDAEARLRVNENGRVVIPAAFRRALGINAGDEETPPESQHGRSH